MQKIIGVTELQRRFRSVFDEVAKRGVPYILMRGSRPEAALIPYKEYLQFQELREDEILKRFDRLVDRMAEQNQEYSDADVEADVEASRAETDTYLTDTDLQTMQLLVELNRSTPAWRKLELVGQMNESVRVLMMTGLRKRHPHASKAELRLRLADLVLGPELAERMYGPLAEAK